MNTHTHTHTHTRAHRHTRKHAHTHHLCLLLLFFWFPMFPIILKEVYLSIYVRCDCDCFLNGILFSMGQNKKETTTRINDQFYQFERLSSFSQSRRTPPCPPCPSYTRVSTFFSSWPPWLFSSQVGTMAVSSPHLPVLPMQLHSFEVLSTSSTWTRMP